MADQQRNRREVAWRMFAREYNASTVIMKGDEDMSPSYVLSPLGAKANRVFLSGVITEVENKGSENEPFWTVRITDPTGIFYLSAGQYQPEAAKKTAVTPCPSQHNRQNQTGTVFRWGQGVANRAAISAPRTPPGKCLHLGLGKAARDWTPTAAYCSDPR